MRLLRPCSSSQPSSSSELRRPVIDGVPCQSYHAGQHGAAISRMLLRRLLIAAILAALLSVLVPLAITLMSPRVSYGEVPELARWAASPLALAVMLLAIDFLLIRGRLAPAISLLTWAGRKDLADLRAATGLTRATDREAMARWLADHPDPSVDSPELQGWRAHLQIVLGEFPAAEATIRAISAATAEDALRLDALRAQLALAQGLPFDAGDLQRQVAALPDGETRARQAAEVAAHIAQARWTCNGDHLGAIAWAVPYAGGRDRGTLLGGYWLPIGGLMLLTSLVITLFFAD
jgi:hypothetical protein